MEIKEVKENIGKTVYYNPDGKVQKYILNACILRKNSNKQFYYQAELLDLTCNHSVLIVSLEKVKTSK